VNGPRQWANPKLFEALGPSMNAKVAPDGLNRGAPLHSVLGFSERVHGWVKVMEYFLEGLGGKFNTIAIPCP